MEEEIRHNRNAFTAPSTDPLDAALERMESARSAAPDAVDDEVEDVELEVDDDETTRTVTTTDDDFDFDDDDDSTDEANTPEEDTVTRKESKEAPKRKQSQRTPKPGEEDSEGSDEEEDDRPLSRKQRGKLIEELRQTIEAEQQQRQRLEQQLQSQREAEAKLEEEVNRALGTDEDYERATEEGLKGDTTAAEKARIWKANRAFYKKLLAKSTSQAQNEFVNYYWKDVQGLPGVTQEALQNPSLSGILKSMYDAGVSSVTDESTKKIEELTDAVETWKGRYKALKIKAGGTKRSPVSGGGESAGASITDWRKKYTDPKTGLFTDEADAIISRYGFEALKDPSIMKKAR